jgi:hypothetical protein
MPALSGYLRADGRKGIRNVVVVVYTVECAHHVARLVVNAFPGQEVHLIGFPGCYPNDYADQMMRRLVTHPHHHYPEQPRYPHQRGGRGRMGTLGARGAGAAAARADGAQ